MAIASFVQSWLSQFWYRVAQFFTGFTLFGAFFTLAANYSVNSGKSFLFLVNQVPVVLGITGLCWFLLQRGGGGAGLFYLPGGESSVAQHAIALETTQSAALKKNRIPWLTLTIASAIVAIYVFSQQYLLFWLAALGFLSVHYFQRLNPQNATTQTIQRSIHFPELVSVLLLCLLAAVVVAVINGPTADDAFYLSVPASLLEKPLAPMLQGDTMRLNPATLPLLLPIYRWTGIEIFWGVCAQLTQLSPIFVAHIFLPPLFAGLSLLSWALLLRVLLEKNYVLALFILFSTLFISGDLIKSQAVFFFYMQLGKAVLICLCVPLIYFYAWSFAMRGRLSNWLILAASQILALGMSSSALFIAPLASGLALAGCWQPNRLKTYRLLAGFAASFYLIFVAFTLRSQVDRDLIELFPTVDISQSIALIMGENWGLLFVQLLAFLAAWLFVPTILQQQQLLSITLGFLLIPINPFLVRWIANHITGGVTYWRIFWAVPTFILVAIFLSEIVNRFLSLIHSKTQAIWQFFLAMLLLLMLRPQTIWHQPELEFTIHPLQYRVPVVEYAAAEILNQLAPPQTTVLAPEAIATWIPTLPGQSYTAYTRYLYMIWFKKDLTDVEFAVRETLFYYISGMNRTDNANQVFADALNKLCISAVAFPQQIPWKTEIEATLKNAQFTPFVHSHGAVDHRYAIWVRSAPQC